MCYFVTDRLIINACPATVRPQLSQYTRIFGFYTYILKATGLKDYVNLVVTNEAFFGSTLLFKIFFIKFLSSVDCTKTLTELVIQKQTNCDYTGCYCFLYSACVVISRNKNQLTTKIVSHFTELLSCLPHLPPETFK